MSQYNKIKNTYLPNPSGSIDIGSDSARFGNLFLANNLALGNSVVTASDVGVPKITNISYIGNDTAADTAGGQTITITGSGFKTSPAVYVDGVIIASVSYVSATSVTFVAPAKSAGSYSLSLVNTDGGTAIFAAGMQYSGVPTWSTSAGSLANVYEYGSVSTTVAATGDAPITYTVSSGSLPSGLSIGSSNGVISGTTVAVASGSTTTNFSLNASDAQNQDTSRNFSITVNADAVTWSSPANATSYSSASGSAISTITLSATSAAGKSITYTANSLPTGLSLSGSSITGTPTVTGNSSSLITATAATTGKTATRTLNWVITNPYVAATGGNPVTVGNYKVHTFTGSSSFDVTSGGTVEYVVVAGGGAGGAAYGAGGGAGGYLTGNLTVTAQSYSVTVGAGGAGANSNPYSGLPGNDSVFSSITSIGGGYGSQLNNNGGNGGSGGGSSQNPGSVYPNYGSGTPGQGNRGGNGSAQTGNTSGGGGGGAGSRGQDADTEAGGAGGNGGTGATTTITGSSLTLAGGGGGSGDYRASRTGGTGGSGIGGAGAGSQNNNAPGGAGTTNTGSGGGGSRGDGGTPKGGQGGSGIVIIKYQFQ